MTLAPNAPLIEINEKAIHLLIDEMGIVNTARFIQQFTTGAGDSVAEKERLFGTQTVAEITSSIRASKQAEKE